MELLTTCVLVLEPSRVSRTSTQMLEPLGPVIEVAASPSASDATSAGHGGALDPAQLWQRAMQAVATPWVLLLVDGEQVELDVDVLVAALGAADASRMTLQSPLVGTAPLVPDPVGVPGPRLLRARQPLRWSLGRPLVATPDGRDPAASGVRIRRRTTSIPLPEASVQWLRGVAVRRSRERRGHEDPLGVLLDAAALTWVGEHDAAAVRAAALLGSSTSTPDVRALAGRVLVGAGLAAGRLSMAIDGAKAWLAVSSADPLAGEDPATPQPALLWAALTMSLSGDLMGAGTVLADHPPPVTADPWLAVAATRPVALALERQAADLEPLLGLLRHNPSTAPLVQLQRLASQWHVLKRDPADLIARWPDGARGRLRELIEECASPTAPWWLPLAAAWSDEHGLQAPVAFRVLQIASQLDDVDAVAWTARLRKGGVENRSPLLVKAAYAGLPARTRVISAALAYSTFSDEQALPVLESAAALVALPDVRELLLIANEVAPSSLPLILEAVAHEPARMRHVADLLEEFGEWEAAEAMRAAAGQR